MKVTFFSVIKAITYTAELRYLRRREIAYALK